MFDKEKLIFAALGASVLLVTALVLFCLLRPGYSVSLVSDKPSYKVGEMIQVRVTYHNGPGTVVSGPDYLKDDDGDEFVVLLQGSGPVTRTGYGKCDIRVIRSSHLDPDDRCESQRPAADVAIQLPGASTDSYIGLSDFFNMTLPGTYLIQLKSRIPGHEVLSNPLTVVVEP